MYEDLINKLRELPHLLFVQLGEHKNVVYQAADAIESLIKAYQMMAEAYEREVTKPKWISVTERLPETRESILGKKSSKVIIAFRFDDGTQGTDTAHTLNGEWVFEDHITVVARTITHWKPLPEPPKEGE